VSGIAIAIERAGSIGRIVHGTYRVIVGDRGRAGREPVRHQVWLVLLHRPTALSWTGRPGAGVPVFEGEEAAGKDVEGHFHVDLHECLGLEQTKSGTFDLIAVLGPWRSAAVELELQGAPRPATTD
jgi:hypothetical protein